MMDEDEFKARISKYKVVRPSNWKGNVCMPSAVASRRRVMEAEGSNERPLETDEHRELWAEKNPKKNDTQR